jgi:hypothetical protein
MNPPKYLIAKYIPDLARMEPRNVGIIVWSPDGVEARFAAEKINQPGVIDGRSIPAFVGSANAFRQWIEFWRAELRKPEIETAEGSRIPQSAPAFLSALQSWNRGNFVLTEGGFLLDPVASDDLSDLADHLFQKLVDSPTTDEIRDPTLDELCDRLIGETNLSRDPHFVSRYPVECPIATNTTETFEFSHAYRNGTLQRLYQRVPFPKRKRDLRKTVHDSAWMLEKVIGANVVTREQSGLLVYATEELQNERPIREAFDVLATVGRVFNLCDYESVRSEFESLPSLVSSHEPSPNT